MIALERAKEIIRLAGPASYLEQWLKVDSAMVYEEGWVHLGDDHFYHEVKRLVAGPVGEDRKRTLVSLTTIDQGDKADFEFVQDISLEWERQVDTGPSTPLKTTEGDEGSLAGEYRSRKQSGSTKCTCDT